MGAVFSKSGGRSARKADAEPLEPGELVKLRKLIRLVREVERATDVEDYLDASEVAKRLDLNKRTVLDLAHAGEFDLGKDCLAFKPAHNRLRIPKRGVQAFINRRAIFSEAGASVGTGEEEA